MKQLKLKVNQNMTILKHINTKIANGSVVRQDELFNPDFNGVNYILNDTTKDCRKKNFHSSGDRCVDNIKFINMGNNVEVVLTLSIGFVEFKLQIFGLIEKIKNARKNCCKLSEIVKLTIKIDSSID